MNTWSQVSNIVPGFTYVFLYNMDSKRIVGAFDASGPPGIEIVKDAWGQSKHGRCRFPAQVPVQRISPPDTSVANRTLSQLRDSYRANAFGAIGARMVRLACCVRLCAAVGLYALAARYIVIPRVFWW